MSYSSDNNVEFSCGCSACQNAMQSSLISGQENSSLSSSSYSNALLLSSGYTWANDKSGLELSYKFFDGLPGYYSAGDVEGNNTQEFNAQMKSATERILEQVESFTNIDFVKSTSTNRDTDLGFGSARLSDGVGGHAYYPFSSPKGGDVWTNNLYGNTENPNEGNYGFFLLLHEIGHALGLQHSFEVLSGSEASSQYSVMAYDWSPYFPASYMVYDIAALQNQYGANTSYNTGDDTYVLDKTVAYSIWDAGGNDTLDATDTRSDVKINLNDGEYSSVGLTNNIGIAFNAIIENAITGSGNDVVIGNEVNNNIQTGDGDDTIYASAGSDTIDGGEGKDKVIYDFDLSQILVSIVDSVTVTFQNLISSAIDTLISIEKFLFDDGSYSFEDITQMAAATDSGGKTPDMIASREGEELSGGAGENYILGLSGNDRFYGGEGNDILNGGTGKNKLFGEGGDDILTVGSSGRNKLDGGNGDDTLTSGGAKNKLIGGEGDDTLTSAGKKNKLIGGGDNDTLNSDGKKNALYGQDGDDTLNAKGYGNILYGDNGNDILSILEGEKNKIFGGDGNDNMSSNGGKNKLSGDDGDDTLRGGALDALIGGKGADIFGFNNTSDQTTVIKDFNIAEDRLDLSDILTQYNAIDDDIADFISFTKQDGRTVISVDQDGAGTASGFEAIATSKVIIDISVNDAETSNILII